MNYIMRLNDGFINMTEDDEELVFIDISYFRNNLRY